MTREKGILGMRRSVFLWYRRISIKALVPGLYLLLPGVLGVPTALWFLGDLPPIDFLGALPPVDFLAVIFDLFIGATFGLLTGLRGVTVLDFWNLCSSRVEWVRNPELMESSDDASSSPLAGGDCFPRGIITTLGSHNSIKAFLSCRSESS